MTAPAARRATYEDVLRAPPNQIAQVVFGVLHTMPRPAYRHARASSRLGNLLGTPFDLGIAGPGGWLILNELELHLGHEPDILVPDIAGWRLERGELPDPDGAWSSVSPDWVCELLSPSTEKLDRGDKMEVYLREKVRHVWLIDPLAKTLEVYRHCGEFWGRTALHAGDAHVQAEPFDAVELDLTPLWVP